MSDVVENIYEALQDEAYARLFFRDQPLADFGDAVLLERLSQGLSQQELATSAEMRQAVISEVENAVGNPTFRTMQRIAGGVRLCITHRIDAINRICGNALLDLKLRMSGTLHRAKRVSTLLAEPLLRETSDAYDVDDISAENESIL